jgi:hypothetical protein
MDETRWQVDVCFFHDGDEREWGEFVRAAWGHDYEESCDFAEFVAFGDKIRQLVAEKGYDGASIDVRQMPDPEPHAYVLSYEYVASTGSVTRWCLFTDEEHQAMLDQD